ncbi:MAG: hypothetical protein AAF458_05865 [Pseudomonadota bacterium]
MKLPFLGATLKRRPTRIFRLSEHAYALACPAERHCWTLHYLLRGTYGNYLLGDPPLDDDLSFVGEGIGGIAKVLPFAPTPGPDAARWFSRFGCRWVIPENPDDIPFGAVPMDAFERSTFTGLRGVRCESVDAGYVWRFRWRGLTVSAGVSPGSGPGPRGSLRLPHQVFGRDGDLDRAIVSLQTSLSTAAASDCLAALNASRPTLCVAVDDLGLIACYDDIQFERNDIDIIGPTQRRELDELLTGLGFERVNPHCYRSHAAVVRIVEPPRTQLNEPLNGVELEPGAITFVTATQAAFEILLAPWTPDRRVDELRRLVALLPVNLRKIDTVLKRRPELLEGHPRERLMAHLWGLQEDTVAYYKPRKPRGLYGRLFRPEREPADEEAPDPDDEGPEIAREPGH